MVILSKNLNLYFSFLICSLHDKNQGISFEFDLIQTLCFCSFIFYPSRHFLLSLHPSGLQIGFLQRMRFLLVLFLIHLHLLVPPCTIWMVSDPWNYDVELDLNADLISYIFFFEKVYSQKKSTSAYKKTSSPANTCPDRGRKTWS